MKNITIFIVFLFLFNFLIATNVWSDDIENEIQKGLSSYKNKQYTEAVSSLEFAAQQIRQLKAQEIEKLFPEALQGWTAEDAESVAVGAIFMGGVIAGSRKYNKGEASVKIEIASDNPMISVVLGVLANPAMMSISGGAKVTKINGQKAVTEWDEQAQRGSIKVVVANKVLITISGEGCKESDIELYANAIDYDKISAFISN